MHAVRSGMPLRAINRVIAICGRTTETAESMATWGGWFMVKYFAICVPWAADLESRTVHKVRRVQAAEWCAVLCECAKYCFAVVLVGSDKNIQILGGSRLGVNAESIASYDKKL